MPETAQSTQAAPRRATQPFPFGAAVVRLPSGNRIRARRQSLMTLISSGGFPSELTAIAWKMFNGDPDVTKFQNLDDLKQMGVFLDTFMTYVFADPVIGETTSVHLDVEGVLTGTVRAVDVPDADKQFLVVWAQSIGEGEVPAESLTQFREESRSGDAGPGGEAVRPAPVESDRPVPAEAGA